MQRINPINRMHATPAVVPHIPHSAMLTYEIVISRQAPVRPLTVQLYSHLSYSNNSDSIECRWGPAESEIPM